MYNKKTVLWAAYLSLFVVGIVMAVLGSALPSIIVKFGVSKQDAGSLFFMLSFGLLIGSMIFGPIVDRYGYKLLLTLAIALIFLGLLTMAITPYFSLLRLVVFLLGFGSGVINGGSSAMVADISEGERSAKLSLLGAFFSLGGFGVPFLLGILLQRFSYESILFGVGLSVVIPLLFFIIPAFPQPKHGQGFPLKQGVGLLKKPVILLIGFIAFFESGLEISVPGWSSTFILEELSTPMDRAVFYLSFYWLGMLGSRFLFSQLMKRISPAKTFRFCLGAAISGSLLMIFTDNLPLTIFGLVLLGVGLAMVFPILLGYIGDIYPELSGTAFSIVLTIALVGGMIIPYVIGMLGNSFGLRYTFAIIPISLTVMLIIFGFARTAMKKVKAIQ